MTKAPGASCRSCQCSSALAVTLGFLALQVVAAEPGEWVKQLEESGRKSDAARSIQQSYVRGLGLQAKTAAQAIEVLLIERFRCGLRAPDDEVVFKEVAMRVRCIQEESKLDAECPTLMLTLNAEWSRMVATRAEMLDQLGSAKIKSVTAGCPVPLVGSAEFIVERERAQNSLEQQVSQLALVGMTGKQAFDRLIANGFDCAIGPADEGGSSFDATLACRRQPSRVQGCFDAGLLLGIRWKKPHRTPRERVRDIGRATVQGIRSQCLLPPIEGDQSA